MKKFLPLLVVAFLIIFCASLHADSRSTTISFLKGLAKTTRKGEVSQTFAKLGMQLSGGDKIETMDNTRVELRLEDGTNVRIGENTSLVIEELTDDKSNNKEKSTLNVMWGKIWMNVRKNTGQESRVITPKIIAAVKGTTYSVEVAKDGESGIKVYDGTVSVSREAQEILLSKLETVTSKDLLKNPLDEKADEKDEWVRWNKSRDKLRVMIIAKETRNKETAVPVSESTVIELFLNNYLFSVVDQSQIEKIRQSEKLKAALKGDAASAAAAGLEFGADLAVVLDTTTGFFSDKELLAGMISASTNISGKVVRTDDALLLAAKNVSSRKVDITEDSAAVAAVKDASKKITGIFIDEILKKWKEEARKGGVFTLTCSNLADLNKVKNVEQALAALDGAKNVEQLYFQGKRALFNLTFAGTAETLAGKIGAIESKGLKFDVVGLTAYRIELEAR
ncbi:MAG: FecR family protein [Candidatus Firestonebacteria bacterium]